MNISLKRKNCAFIGLFLQRQEQAQRAAQKKQATVATPETVKKWLLRPKKVTVQGTSKAPKRTITDSDESDSDDNKEEGQGEQPEQPSDQPQNEEDPEEPNEGNKN